MKKKRNHSSHAQYEIYNDKLPHPPTWQRFTGHWNDYSGFIEMNTAPVNCGSQRFHSKALPLDYFRGSTEWAKEKISVTTEGKHKWMFTYQGRPTINNEWTTSITSSVIDKGFICFKPPCWGPMKAVCLCYTAAERHGADSFDFSFLNILS